jgi:hypothetical protein
MLVGDYLTASALQQATGGYFLILQRHGWLRFTTGCVKHSLNSSEILLTEEMVCEAMLATSEVVDTPVSSL